jgi:hypothetical protein
MAELDTEAIGWRKGDDKNLPEAGRKKPIPEWKEKDRNKRRKCGRIDINVTYR